MKTVQPIRDKKKIAIMKTLLKEKGDKYYILFRVGINVGLRVSDLLLLKVTDVRERSHVTIIEKKTGKTRRFLIPNSLQKEIAAYIEKNNMKDEDYLIQSRKGDNRPITRIQAYRVLNEIAKQIGLDEVGTHTMRKTFGYHYYQANKDVALLQSLFGHASQRTTLIYIGLTDDMKDNSLKGFDL